MQLIAVSDLHVRGPDDPLYRSLLALIATRCASGDVLVLNGDLFDLFIGNKPIFTRRYAEFIEAVRVVAARGTRVYYIEGNHDFLLSGLFDGIPGVSLHADEAAAVIAGKRFLFAHGDLADPSDTGYRFLRAFWRSAPLRFLGRVFPGEWVDWIGEQSSRRSRSRKPELASRMVEGSIERLRKIYRNYAAERIARDGYDYVIMGHCHDLDEMSFVVDGRAGQYINIGYPRAHGSFVSWAPGDAKLGRERMPVV